MILIVDEVSFASSTMLEQLEHLLFLMRMKRYMNRYMAAYGALSQLDIGIIVNRQANTIIIIGVHETQRRGSLHIHVPFFPHAIAETAFNDDSYDSEELEHVD